MGKSLSTFLGAKGGQDLMEMGPEAMGQALLDDAGDAGGGEGGFINFSGKRGEYFYGRDRTDLDLDDRYVINAYSLGGGWCCWKNSRPVDRVRWSVGKSGEIVAEDDLEDHGPYNEKIGEGWREERMFSCQSLDAELQGTFTTTSVSGCNSVRDLQIKIGKQSQSLEACHPIIRFDMVEFEAQGAKNWKPTFEVLGWVTDDQLQAWSDDKLTVDQMIAGKQPRKQRGKPRK